ncbi:MAG: hypothetical protein HYX60_08100 [Legionella longbeachae]|nr:hypothetical protein [Legionella longbeachae]
MYEKNGNFRTTGGEIIHSEYYLGSKYLEEFETFRMFYEKTKKQIIKNTFRLNKSRFSEDEVRQIIFDKFVNKVGEHEFAKLAVSGTFIQDLVMNFGNWGIVNNQIAVIDADHSPQSIDEYMTETKKMPGNIEIPFSLNTVLHMKSIYESMLKLGPIKLGLSVDMPDKQYSILVKYYLNACHLAIDNIKKDFPTRDPNQRSKEINLILSEAFLTQYQYFSEPKLKRSILN